MVEILSQISLISQNFCNFIVTLHVWKYSFAGAFMWIAWNISEQLNGLDIVWITFQRKYDGAFLQKKLTAFTR